jgi:hypothetical protein
MINIIYIILDKICPNKNQHLDISSVHVIVCMSSFGVIMFSAIYLNIALLYLLVCIVVVLSLYAIAQLPCGIHSHETVYMRCVQLFRFIITKISKINDSAIRIKDSVTVKSESF